MQDLTLGILLVWKWKLGKVRDTIHSFLANGFTINFPLHPKTKWATSHHIPSDKIYQAKNRKQFITDEAMQSAHYQIYKVHIALQMYFQAIAPNQHSESHPEIRQETVNQEHKVIRK